MRCWGILSLLWFVGLSEGMKNKDSFSNLATLGAGCFWCVEAVFQQIEGVENVQSGYSGGNSKKPTYKEVCSGKSNHAEVIQIKFNSKILNLDIHREAT